MLSFELWNHASETTSAFPLGQPTIFGWWGNTGPWPALWSWYGIGSIRDIMARLACLNVTETVSANLSFCLSPYTLLCTYTKCQHEQLPWQRLPLFPPTLDLFWSKQCSTFITPHLSFSFFPHFSVFPTGTSIKKYSLAPFSIYAGSK